MSEPVTAAPRPPSGRRAMARSTIGIFLVRGFDTALSFLVAILLANRFGAGAQLDAFDSQGRADWKLFGETAATAWALVSPDQTDAVLAAAAEHGVPAKVTGTVGGDALRIDGTSLDMPLETLIETYNAHHITTKKAD